MYQRAHALPRTALTDSAGSGTLWQLQFISIISGRIKHSRVIHGIAPSLPDTPSAIRQPNWRQLAKICQMFMHVRHTPAGVHLTLLMAAVAIMSC